MIVLHLHDFFFLNFHRSPSTIFIVPGRTLECQTPMATCQSCGALLPSSDLGEHIRSECGQWIDADLTCRKPTKTYKYICYFSWFEQIIWFSSFRRNWIGLPDDIPWLIKSRLPWYAVLKCANLNWKPLPKIHYEKIHVGTNFWNLLT